LIIPDARPLELDPDGERREEPRPHGRVAVDLRNTRCFDKFEIACDDGAKV